MIESSGNSNEINWQTAEHEAEKASRHWVELARLIDAPEGGMLFEAFMGTNSSFEDLVRMLEDRKNDTNANAARERRHWAVISFKAMEHSMYILELSDKLHEGEVHQHLKAYGQSIDALYRALETISKGAFKFPEDPAIKPAN